MNLSALTLQQLVQELSPNVTRRLIREAFQTNKNTLFLNLGDVGHLCFSSHPTRSYIRFEEPDAKPLANQPNWLAHQVTKSGIVSITHVPNERIIILQLSKKDRLGTESEYKLVLELIGRHANAILMETQNNKILGALRHTQPKQSNSRVILPGRTYEAPPSQSGVEPHNLTPSHLKQAIEENADTPLKMLQNTIIGLDEITAQELCHRAQFDPKETSTITDERIEKMKHFFAAPPFITGSVVVADSQSRLQLSPLQITYTTPSESFETISQGITYLLAQQNVQGALKGQITNLEKDLRAKISNSERKLERIAEDIQDALRSPEYEKMGNLLMSNLQHIPPQADSITLKDLFEGQEKEVHIPLNPERSAIDNANEYLKRSQKGRKATPILEKRRIETKQDIDRIAAYLDQLAKISSEKELSKLREELEQHKYIKPPKKNKNKNQNQQRAKGEIHPRRYRTRDGWLVLVGRNNHENDKLTKSSARDDIFFHVHGCPGSHVILKQEGRVEKPPRSTVKEAASLAAYWSKARGANTAPVSYTEIRYVQKPKGAPAGLVTIKNEKSIMVHPQEIQKEDEF